MKITKMSDVLKGTINGEGGGRVDLHCSSFALVFNSDFAQKRKLIESGNHFQSFLPSKLRHALSSQWVRLLAWEKGN